MRMWGAAWLPSTRTGMPRAWARAMTSLIGTMVPIAFETWVMATRRVLGPSSASNSSSRKLPSSSMGAMRNSMPMRSRSRCQGTMLEWCSRAEMTTSSPAFMKARPKQSAIRLSASVALRVNTIWSDEPALMKRATFSRPASKASVQSWLMRCTPRWTLE